MIYENEPKATSFKINQAVTYAAVAHIGTPEKHYPPKQTDKN